MCNLRLNSWFLSLWSLKRLVKYIKHVRLEIIKPSFDGILIHQYLYQKNIEIGQLLLKLSLAGGWYSFLRQSVVQHAYAGKDLKLRSLTTDK